MCNSRIHLFAAPEVWNENLGRHNSHLVSNNLPRMWSSLCILLNMGWLANHGDRGWHFQAHQVFLCLVNSFQSTSLASSLEREYNSLFYLNFRLHLSIKWSYHYFDNSLVCTHYIYTEYLRFDSSVGGLCMQPPASAREPLTRRQKVIDETN